MRSPFYPLPFFVALCFIEIAKRDRIDSNHLSLVVNAGGATGFDVFGAWGRIGFNKDEDVVIFLDLSNSHVICLIGKG